MSNPLTSTREEWLQLVVARFRKPILTLGLTLPETIHVSVGFPSTGALSARRRRVAECWLGETSKDGNPHILISPLLNDFDALHSLLHEMIHAGGIRGHKRDFRKYAEGIGLTGKMTQSVPGPELTERLNRLLEVIGESGHSQLSIVKKGDRDKDKKKSTVKLICNTNPKHVLTMSSKMVDDPGIPQVVCACGGEYSLEEG